MVDDQLRLMASEMDVWVVIVVQLRLMAFKMNDRVMIVDQLRLMASEMDDWVVIVDQLRLMAFKMNDRVLGNGILDEWLSLNVAISYD